MAQLTDPTRHPPSEDPDLSFDRVPRTEQVTALSLLLTGQLQAESSVVSQFLAFAREQRLSLSELWIARRRGRPVAAALLVPSAGRTAMVFLSPIRRLHDSQVAAQLMAAVCRAQSPEQLCLTQALLDPSQQAEAAALEQAGFSHLARLVYMSRRADLPPQELKLNPSLTVSTWNAALHDRFAAAIQRSYEQTLDCPGLMGLREMDDVIVGHRGTGHFSPDLWLLIERGDEPVGVLLCNEVLHRRALELVYLGLAPAWRGQGIARRLVRYAIGMAKQCASESIILAVDEQNTPAMRLYREQGFAINARKVAMVYVHRQPSHDDSHDGVT